MAGKRLDNPIWSSSCLSLPSWGSATNRLVHSYWPGCSVSHPHRAQWISQSVKLQFCSWKPFSSVSSCLVVHLLHIFHGVKICLGFFFFLEWQSLQSDLAPRCTKSEDVFPWKAENHRCHSPSAPTLHILLKIELFHFGVSLKETNIQRF